MGTSQALAKGYLHANHGHYVNGVLRFEVIPAEVRLFRIRPGCGGRLFYTREDVRTRFGSTKNGVLSESCRPGL